MDSHCLQQDLYTLDCDAVNDVDWMILDFFRGCSPMLSFFSNVSDEWLKHDGFYPTLWLQGYNDFRPTRLDFARFG